jgi:hypothetical protein
MLPRPTGMTGILSPQEEDRKKTGRRQQSEDQLLFRDMVRKAMM